MNKSENLFERAKALIPGGVNSPVRAFRSVGGTPFFTKKGRRLPPLRPLTAMNYWISFVLGDPRYTDIIIRSLRMPYPELYPTEQASAHPALRKWKWLN